MPATGKRLLLRSRPTTSEGAFHVTTAIVELAGRAFGGGTSRNWAHASVVAETLGVQNTEQILACVVHPPAAPTGTHVLDWIPRVQLSVAQVLAHLDDGWEDSVRRRALLSILHGPMDWGVTAAILVLCRLVEDRPELFCDVNDALTTLRVNMPNSGHVCYEEALYWSWMRLPQLFDDERQALEAAYERLQDTD